MQRTQLVFLNTVAQISGQLVGMAVSLATFVFLARYLGASAYGEYSTIVTYLGFFATVADWSLYVLIVQRLTTGASQEEESKGFGEILAFRLVLAILSLAVGLLVVVLFPYSRLVKIGITIGALSFLSSSLSQLVYAIFQARLKLYLTASLDLSYRVLLLIFVIISSKMGWGLLPIVGGMVISATTILLVGLLISRRQLPFHLRDIRLSWPRTKTIIGSSWGLALSSIFSNLVYRVSIILLSVMASSTVVGLYSMPAKIVELLTILPGSFVGSVFPIINNYYVSKDPRLQRSLDRSSLFLMLFAALVTTLVFVLAGPIIMFAGGQEFRASIPVMQLLAFYPVFAFFGNYFYYLAVTVGKQAQIAWRTGSMLVINVILTVILIPLISLKGAAVGILAAEAIGTYLSFRIIRAEMRVHIPPLVFLKTLVVTFLTGYLLYLGWNQFYSLDAFAAAGRLKEILALAAGLGGGALLFLVLIISLRIISLAEVKELVYRPKA